MNENRDLNQRENGINPSELSGKGDYYFSNGVQERTPRTTPVGTKRKPAKKGNGVKSTYVFFIVVIVVSMALSVYAVFCMNDILAITKTKSTVTVSMQEEVKTASDAIDLLADQGLIKCKGFCKFFATLHDKVLNDPIGGPYPAGVYYLNGKMGLEGMLQTLQGSSATSETVTLIFPEGMTVPEIVNKLTENDVCDKTALLSVIDSTEFTYSMVADLKANEHVPYRLEGFMLPDTYEFFVGENASSVVKKFLSNGDSKISEKDRAQAKKLGYSMYEVMTIASIIQKEAGSEKQMKTISSVIHNRLSDKTNFPSLGCQSTSDYITNFVKPNLSSTSAHTADYIWSITTRRPPLRWWGCLPVLFATRVKRPFRRRSIRRIPVIITSSTTPRATCTLPRPMPSLSRRYRPTPPIWLHDEAGRTVVPGRGYGTAGIGSQVRCRRGVCGRNPIRYALQPIQF